MLNFIFRFTDISNAQNDEDLEKCVVQLHRYGIEIDGSDSEIEGEDGQEDYEISEYDSLDDDDVSNASSFEDDY